MLHRIKITSQQDSNFPMCWNLYQDAFPRDERRSQEYHLSTLEQDGFHFEAIFDDDEFIGIIAWWQFSTSRYIEHLATAPAVRDGGYGKKILESFIAQGNDPLILEVEHPTCPMSTRRIGFYQRLGFVLNNYDYSHPSYWIDCNERVSLMLMSYPHPLSPQQFEEFKQECYTKVHFGQNH